MLPGKPGEHEQVVSKDDGTHGRRVVPPALVEASEHPKRTLQYGYRAFDACSKSLRHLERSSRLAGRLLVGLVPLLPDRYDLDLVDLRHASVEPLVGGELAGRLAEQLLAMVRDPSAIRNQRGGFLLSDPDHVDHAGLQDQRDPQDFASFLVENEGSRGLRHR